MNAKRKRACYQIQNESPLKGKQDPYEPEIDESCISSNCTCGYCIAEVQKFKVSRQRNSDVSYATSSSLSREQAMKEYSFNGDDDDDSKRTSTCNCIFCWTIDYPMHSERVCESVVFAGIERRKATKHEFLWGNFSQARALANTLLQLKGKVVKLGKENIPSCKAPLLYPERKFFRHGSLREKDLAREKRARTFSEVREDETSIEGNDDENGCLTELEE